MTFAAMIESMGARAIDTLADFDRDLAVSAGLDPKKVGAWAGLHEVYYGSTNAPAQQRRAREAARRGGFSLDQLLLIERKVSKLPNPAAKREMRLRLLGLKGVRGSYSRLESEAKTIAPVQKRAPKNRIAFSRSVDNKRTMILTADERDMADLEHHLRYGADPSKAAGQQMFERFWALVRGEDGASSAGVAPAAPRPLLLIPLPEWVKILDGHGDDTILGLTDGTTMTGAQFLAQHYATAGFQLEAAVFHPAEGPVNLYRIERGPNSKMRALLRATTPVCPTPGCKQPADHCDIHHVTAWKNGGQTNLDNLAVLCRYHNQINDDDPANGPPDLVPGEKKRRKRRKAGRIIIRNGERVWQSPRGFVVPNDHASIGFGAMNALFGDPGSAAA